MTRLCQKCGAEISDGSPVCRSCFEPVKSEGFLARLVRLLPELAKQSSLLGVVAMGRAVGWDFDGDRPRLRHPWIFKARAFTEQGAAGRVVDELFQRLQVDAGARMDESLRELGRDLAGRD